MTTLATAAARTTPGPARRTRRCRSSASRVETVCGADGRSLNVCNPAGDGYSQSVICPFACEGDDHCTLASNLPQANQEECTGDPPALTPAPGTTVRIVGSGNGRIECDPDCGDGATQFIDAAGVLDDGPQQVSHFCLSRLDIPADVNVTTDPGLPRSILLFVTGTAAVAGTITIDGGAGSRDRPPAPAGRAARSARYAPPTAAADGGGNCPGQGGTKADRPGPNDDAGGGGGGGGYGDRRRVRRRRPGRHGDARRRRRGRQHLRRDGSRSSDRRQRRRRRRRRQLQRRLRLAGRRRAAARSRSRPSGASPSAGTINARGGAGFGSTDASLGRGGGGGGGAGGGILLEGPTLTIAGGALVVEGGAGGAALAGNGGGGGAQATATGGEGADATVNNQGGAGGGGSGGRVRLNATVPTSVRGSDLARRRSATRPASAAAAASAASSPAGRPLTAAT